jgi:hypothetical protein
LKLLLLKKIGAGLKSADFEFLVSLLQKFTLHELDVRHKGVAERKKQLNVQKGAIRNKYQIKEFNPRARKIVSVRKKN